MGLSIIVSGVIISVVFIAVLASMPALFDSLVSVGESSTKTFDLEDSILKTDLEITSLTASSGDDIVSFELLNVGEEKVWDWSEFDLFVTYDANIGGTKTRVTEQLTYNDIGLGLTADFNIQRGLFTFGAGEDADTVTLAAPVGSFGDGSNAFVRLTNVQHASSGGLDFDETDNNDDVGVLVKITATDTITFTRQGTGQNLDWIASWELWEYIGPPGGPNEFIVRHETEVTTTGQTAVNTLIPNVVNRDNLVPFITGVVNSQTDNDWDDATHTAEITDGGAGISYLTVHRDGSDTNPSNVGIAVVEFTGSNWKVQNNIFHSFTNDGVTESETLPTPVTGWTDAFIAVSYHTDNGDDERNEVGHNVWPGATNDQVNFRIREGANGAYPDYHAMVHVVENPDMSVVHLDSITGLGVDLPCCVPQPQIETRNFAPAVANLAESGLLATVDNEGDGNPIVRAFWNYQLTGTDEVTFRKGANDGAGDWALQAIAFPRLNNPLAASLWSVFDIKNDYMDPGILNNQETIHISAQLSNPVFQGGTVIVKIASDRGIQASESKVVV